MSVNKVILLGHLGAGAELRYTQSGKAVTSFSLATSRNWKGADGQKKTETEWHRCVMWDSESVSRFLTKGKQVYIEGTLKTRKYEDKQGVERKTTEVVVLALQLMGGGAKDEDPSAAPTPTPHVTNDELDRMGISDDDVPF